MAITTTPTAAQLLAIKTEFQNEFGGASPPATEDAIATAMAVVLGKVYELAMIEVKTNAKVPNGTAGGDTLDVD